MIEFYNFVLIFALKTTIFFYFNLKSFFPKNTAFPNLVLSVSCFGLSHQNYLSYDLRFSEWCNHYYMLCLLALSVYHVVISSDRIRVWPWPITHYASTNSLVFLVWTCLLSPEHQCQIPLYESYTSDRKTRQHHTIK